MRLAKLFFILLALSQLACAQQNQESHAVLAIGETPTDEEAKKRLKECSDFINSEPEPKTMDQLFTTVSKYALCATNQNTDVLAKMQFSIGKDCLLPSTLNRIELCSLIAGSDQGGCSDICHPKTGTCHTACLYSYKYKVGALEGLAKLQFDYKNLTIAPFQASSDGNAFTTTIAVETQPLPLTAFIDADATGAGIPAGFHGGLLLGTGIRGHMKINLRMDCIQPSNSFLTISIGELSLSGLDFGLPIPGLKDKINDAMNNLIVPRLAPILDNLIRTGLGKSAMLPNPLFCPTWGCGKVDGIANTGVCTLGLDSADNTTYFERKGACQTECSKPQGFTCLRLGDKPPQCVEMGLNAISPGSVSYNACKTSCPCKADSDCRLFDNYCGGCKCEALGVGEPDPECPFGDTVSCFVAPCSVGKAAKCLNGKCSLSGR
jgi:hypothetical protein